MSEENVELVRRATDAFAAEDVEGLVECADPAIEFEPHLAGVEGSYSGREGIREFMADAFETLEMRGMDYAEIRDLGDRVLALGAFHIHGRESGIEDDIPFALVVTIRAGLIVHLKDYGNKVSRAAVPAFQMWYRGVAERPSPPRCRNHGPSPGTGAWVLRAGSAEAAGPTWLRTRRVSPAPVSLGG